MQSSRKQVRQQKIDQAKRRIADGFYDSARVLDQIFRARRLDVILRDLDAIPIGDGNAYRDGVAELLSKCLHEVVDVPMVNTEFACHGSRGDIELPLKIEVLPDYPLWQIWANRYDAMSIIVEAKNEKGKTDSGAVRQIHSYLNLARRGRLGFLVSRAGFTANAMDQLTHVAAGGANLILPFTHQDLSQLLKARRDGSIAVMGYVRRKHTLLLQRAG